MDQRRIKAQQIKNSVMQVNENTFAVPSQFREGKAHIVKIEEKENKEKMVIIENRFLIEADQILNTLTKSQYRSERVKDLLRSLSRRKNRSVKIYTCSCEDFKFNKLNTCKHILAVQMKREEI